MRCEAPKSRRGLAGVMARHFLFFLPFLPFFFLRFDCNPSELDDYPPVTNILPSLSQASADSPISVDAKIPI